MATKTITGNGDTNLGDSGTGNVSTKVIQFKGTGWTGNITLQARRVGAAAGFGYVPIPYRRRYLNGAVSDDQFGSAVITGDSLIEVNTAGVELNLNTAGFAAGSMAVDFGDLDG